MKKLWNKLFKNEPQFNYTIVDYLPIRASSLEAKVKVTEHEIEARLRANEMEVDNIYQQQ